jgi:hypothetical protein
VAVVVQVDLSSSDDAEYGQGNFSVAIERRLWLPALLDFVKQVNPERQFVFRPIWRHRLTQRCVDCVGICDDEAFSDYEPRADDREQLRSLAGLNYRRHKRNDGGSNLCE